MRNKKKNKIEKTLKGKREGTWQPRVVLTRGDANEKRRQ